MPTVAEAAAAKTQLAGDIAAGVNTLSLNQTITFTKYVKLVLPLDGFVFWVKADLLSPSALLNAGLLNRFAPNEPRTIVTPAPTVSVQGSLHYSTVKQQNEDETAGVNQVVFTALAPIQDFNQIGPDVIFIGTFQKIRFAFSQRQPFYAQADTYHYVGTAILPAMESQIIDAVDGFNSRELVVSNSLPIWLSLNSYAPPYPGFQIANMGLRLYPSFALPDNIAPPYGAVHIPPEATEALQSAPLLGPTYSHSQLVRDTVKITLYGVRNGEALTVVDTVNQFSLDTDAIGVMNMPTVRDEKRTQAELAILAMKKTVTFEVSYYQTTARNMARQLITKAIVDYRPQAFAA